MSHDLGIGIFAAGISGHFGYAMRWDARAGRIPHPNANLNPRRCSGSLVGGVEDPAARQIALFACGVPIQCHS